MMVEDIIDLPPELGYEIFKFCNKSDLLNFACCSQAHYDTVKYLLFKNICIPWKIVETKQFQPEELDNFKFASSLCFSDYDLRSIFSKIGWHSISTNYQQILLHTDSEILSSLTLESITINEDNTMTILLPSNLKSISLKQCCGISLADWQYIGNLNCLETLSICQCNFNDSSMENLVANSKIQTLDLVQIPDITERSLELLTELETLRKLEICSCESIDSNGYKHLAHLKELRELRISNVDISLNSLTSLSSLKSLRDLQIERTSAHYWTSHTTNENNYTPFYANFSLLEHLLLWSADGIVGDENLCELAQLRHLKHLDLSLNNFLNDAGFFQLCNLPQLTELNISYCESITDDGLSRIKQLTSLKSLDISFCSFLTDECMKHIKELTFLEKLYSSYTRISDQGIDYLSPLASLRSLDVSGCNDVTDIGMFCIGHKNRSLERLILTCCTDITEVGIEYIKDLKLIELDISLDLYKMQGRCMKINDEALRHVSFISTLRHLDISCCHYINDAGLEYISKLESLASLDISRCPKVTDVGLAYLSNLNHLKEIDISMCVSLTDIGIEYLCHMRSLKYIDLHGCSQVTNIWPSKYPYKIFRYRCLKRR